MYEYLCSRDRFRFRFAIDLLLVHCETERERRSKRITVCVNTEQAIMDGLAGAGRPMVAPMALFFLTSDKQLVPLAIQLQQRIHEQNPVFLPTDPPNVWYSSSSSSSTHLSATCKP